MTDVVFPVSPEVHLPNPAIRPNQQRSTQRNPNSSQHDRSRKTNKKKQSFHQKLIKERIKSKGTEEKMNGHAHQCAGEPVRKPSQFNETNLEMRDYSDRNFYSP